METYVFLEPDIGGKGEKNMNKRKIIYTEAPKDISRDISGGKILVDFLPPPEKLIRKEPKVKVTITLNTGSVDFFKKHAQKNNVKYQTMINEVLAKYVQRYKEKSIV
jgi:predicted DNA binding CopG/RHH family protein